ncbi:MAG: Crp/Fnr family transcriptional regulator [Prevotella sp.]|nr:Crp/Fnr family transcriptional regulator [Prevotella sp.]MCM1075353.1 Crp/Fnr family transcriptional regulator [Ruminococcus sp.]
MAGNFNTYINNIEVDFWRDLCVNHGELRCYSKGDDFVKAGTVGRYIGYIKSGTLKYVEYSCDGAEHVIGLEFADEFVTDFPFSIYGNKSRASINAVSDCEIYCIQVSEVRKLMESDNRVKEIVMHSTEAVFATVYDRYVALYTQTPQQRYDELVRRHPDLFTLFSLKDIASFLNITPTHLSRLRKNI